MPTSGNPEGEPNWEDVVSSWAEEFAQSDAEAVVPVSISKPTEAPVSKVGEWMTSREWDFVLPSQCQDCPEANCDINVAQDLTERIKNAGADNGGIITPERLYRAIKNFIEFIDEHCPGMTTPTMSPDDPYIKAEFDVSDVMPESRPDKSECPLNMNFMQFLMSEPE